MDDSSGVVATSIQSTLEDHDRALGWVELRDGTGKLQGKWDPVAGLLEIQVRRVKTMYRLIVGEKSN